MNQFIDYFTQKFVFMYNITFLLFITILFAIVTTTTTYISTSITMILNS